MKYRFILFFLACWKHFSYELLLVFMSLVLLCEKYSFAVSFKISSQSSDGNDMWNLCVIICFPVK